jgi:hypothetical protein
VIYGKAATLTGRHATTRRSVRFRSHDALHRMRVPSGNGQGDLGPAVADRDAAGHRAGRAPAQPRGITDAPTVVQAARHKTTRILQPDHEHFAVVQPRTGEASLILLPRDDPD